MIEDDMYTGTIKDENIPYKICTFKKLKQSDEEVKAQLTMLDT